MKRTMLIVSACAIVLGVAIYVLFQSTTHDTSNAVVVSAPDEVDVVVAEKAIVKNANSVADVAELPADSQKTLEVDDWLETLMEAAGADEPPQALSERESSPAGFPPFMDAQGRTLDASPGDEIMWQRAQEIIMASGPDAASHAMGLLTSGPQEQSLIGAAIMLRQPSWSQEVVDVIQRHPHPAVPLVAWQGLRDHGRWEEAGKLDAIAKERLANIKDWASYLDGHTFPGTAVRGMVEMARDWADEERRLGMLDAIMDQQDLDYGGRMRALLEYRDIVEFTEYRAHVYRELKKGGADPVWNIGLDRLADRIEGPPEVHTGPPAMTATDIDLMTSREHPAMYEDIALAIEVAMNRENALFGEGLKTRLEALMEARKNQPLSSSEQEALQRIETMIPFILEQDLSANPAFQQPPGI